MRNGNSPDSSTTLQEGPHVCVVIVKLTNSRHKFEHYLSGIVQNNAKRTVVLAIKENERKNSFFLLPFLKRHFSRQSHD